MQLLENLEKIKRTKNGVFRFQSLINHIFFDVLKIFPYLSVTKIMSSERCTMEKITEVFRRHTTYKILDSGNLIMNFFYYQVFTVQYLIYRMPSTYFYDLLHYTSVTTHYINK